MKWYIHGSVCFPHHNIHAATNWYIVAEDALHTYLVNIDEWVRTNIWCYENGMPLSFEKTKAMLILSKAKESRLAETEIDINININGTKIPNKKNS